MNYENKGGLRICSEAANEIKKLVLDSINAFGRVIPEVARLSRKYAREDAEVNHNSIWHSEPAVKPKQ